MRRILFFAKPLFFDCFDLAKTHITMEQTCKG